MKYEIIILVITLSIIIIIGLCMVNKLEKNLVYLECCDGNPCTDTYYSQEDNLCHLTMCENFPLFNNGNCTYEGTGIIVNISNNAIAD